MMRSKRWPFSKLRVVEMLWRNLGERRKLRKGRAWRLLREWRDLWKRRKWLVRNGWQGFWLVNRNRWKWWKRLLIDWNRRRKRFMVYRHRRRKRFLVYRNRRRKRFMVYRNRRGFTDWNWRLVDRNRWFVDWNRRRKWFMVNRNRWRKRFFVDWWEKWVVVVVEAFQWGKWRKLMQWMFPLLMVWPKEG